MRVSLAIKRMNYALRGLDDDPPAANTPEWLYWVDTLNRIKDSLYEDVAKLWSEIHETRTAGTISASDALEFDLDDDFLAASKKPFVVTTLGQRVYLDVVKPYDADETKQSVYFEGSNPIRIVFTKEILEDDRLFDGELFVSGYWMPADVIKENQDIPFPDPNWGLMAAASEIAFNDIVYEEKAPDINEKANDLWKKMLKKNQRGVRDGPRTIPRASSRITGPGKR